MKKYLIFLFVVTMLCGGNSYAARQNVLSGSISLLNDYNSNVFRTDSSRVDEWNSEIAPEISLSSVGPSDNLSLKYSPKFSYNHRRGEDEMVHDLSLLADKAISSHWRLGVADDYVYFDNPIFEADTSQTLGQQFLRADDATQTEIVRLLFPEITWDNDQLTYVLSLVDQRYNDAPGSVQVEVDRLLDPLAAGQSRQRYWSNDLSFHSDYEFARNSLLSLGYSFNLYDNKTGVQTDREEHNPSISVSYEFLPGWSVEAGYGFTQTNYDTADDSQTDSPSLQLNYQHASGHTAYLAYDYESIDYEGSSDDSQTQHSSLGGVYLFDQRTTLNGVTAVSYQGRDLAADERDLSFDLGLVRQIKQGSMGVTGGLELSETKLSGAWDKLDRSWDLGLDMTYKLAEKVTSSGNLSYEQRFSWTGGTKITYDDLSLGCDVSYGFAKWFTFNIGYDFRLFDTDSASLDDYTEHRVSFTLSAAKDLRRW